jgi:hypothetical protein
MEHILNDNTYYQVLDISGFVIEAIVVGFFCYFLFRKINPLKKREKGHSRKIDGPAGTDN